MYLCLYGIRDYWQFYNSALNKNKFYLFTQVLTSADKANSFLVNLLQNQLDANYVYLPVNFALCFC